MPDGHLYLPVSSDGKTIEYRWSSPTNVSSVISQSWQFTAGY